MKGNYDGVCLRICRILSVVIMYLRKLLGLRFGVVIFVDRKTFCKVFLHLLPALK